MITKRPYKRVKNIQRKAVKYEKSRGKISSTNNAKYKIFLFNLFVVRSSTARTKLLLPYNNFIIFPFCHLILGLSSFNKTIPLIFNIG